MGQEQSALNKTVDELNEKYTVLQVERLAVENKITRALTELNRSTKTNWIPTSIKGQIILWERPDNTMVKELWIPEWSVVFYNNGVEGVSVGDLISYEGPSSPVTVDKEDATILHSMWVKFYQVRSVGVLAQPLLQHYLTRAQ